MDLFFGEPVDWDALEEPERQRSFVDEDFCEVRYSDGAVDRFIRCLLPLTVPELGEDFRFGTWVSVSERSWDIYRKGFRTGDYGMECCFGYLMHDIPDYPGSLLLNTDVWFQPDDRRPIVQLHDVDHPLVAAQKNGIDVAQVVRWASLMHTG